MDDIFKNKKNKCVDQTSVGTIKWYYDIMALDAGI